MKLLTSICIVDTCLVYMFRYLASVLCQRLLERFMTSWLRAPPVSASATREGELTED
jgi:hypothetical protein